MPDDPKQPDPAAPAVPAAAPAAGPIKVADPSKPDGFQYFNTPEEVIKAKEETNRFAWEMKQEVEKLRQEQERFRAGIQSVVAPQTTSGQPRFDSNHYYGLLAEDPIAANRYALQFTPEWQALQEERQKNRLTTVTQVFMANTPTFEPTKENVSSLFEVAGAMGLDERTVNPHQMSAAYHYAVALGKIKPAAMTTQPPAPNGGTNPPPVLPTTSTLTTSQSSDISAQLLQARSQTERDEILRNHGIQPPPT